MLEGVQAVDASVVVVKRRLAPPPMLEGVQAVDASVVITKRGSTQPTKAAGSESQVMVTKSVRFTESGERGGEPTATNSTVMAGQQVSSIAFSDDGLKIRLRGKYRVGASGVHELNPVTGSLAHGGLTFASVAPTRRRAELPDGGVAVEWSDEDAPPSAEDGICVSHLSELSFTEDSMTIIGSGSSGKAYRVRHLPSGKEVCCKELYFDDPRQRTEVSRELEALRSIHSRHVVTLYGAFFSPDTMSVVLAMELMDGSIKDVMKRRGVLTEAQAQAMALQIVKGLHVLHSPAAGGGLGESRRVILHRDIKPANILVNKAGCVKVADFGISKVCVRAGGGGPREEDDTVMEGLLHDNCLSNTFVGSMAYMSPERLGGKGYGMGGDIWSLGVLLVEALTGSHPFRNPSEPLEFWGLRSMLGDENPTFHSNPLLGVVRAQHAFRNALPLHERDSMCIVVRHTPSGVYCASSGLPLGEELTVRAGGRRSEGAATQQAASTSCPLLVVEDGATPWSADAQDFVAFCLGYHMLDRATTQDLLAHPWVSSLSDEEGRIVMAAACSDL
jgi:serine/threonine protein kinase